MKLHALALPLLLLAPCAPASAQLPSSPGDGGKRIYNWCIRLDTGSVSECSCVAGFFAAATDEDEFQILSTAVEFFGPDGSIADTEGAQAAVRAMQTQLEMSEDRFQALMQRFTTFDALGKKADAVCMPVETHAQTLAELPAELPPETPAAN